MNAIEPSGTEWTSSVAIPSIKRNAEFCLNYDKANSLTVQYLYPLSGKD